MGAEDMDAGSEKRLMDAVERLTRIQKSVLELNQEANRIRRHIKDFDVNLDALNILANVRSKDEKDGGVQVLEDLIRYARETGTQLTACEMRVPPREDTPLTLDDSVKSTVEKKLEYTKERESQGLLRILSQLLIAAAITSGLFVLIH